MARKTKAELEAEARALEVATAIAEEVKNLIVKQYPAITASFDDYGYNGVPISLRFRIQKNHTASQIDCTMPRKAIKVSAKPLTPSEKAQMQLDLEERERQEREDEEEQRKWEEQCKAEREAAKAAKASKKKGKSKPAANEDDNQEDQDDA